MSTLLRIAAVISLIWAAVLWWGKSVAFGAAANEPLAAALATSLGVAQVVMAFMLWRASVHPERERTVIYGALILFGVRVITGTHGILYGEDGAPAIVSLVDMVTGLALFVGIVNALPRTLRQE